MVFCPHRRITSRRSCAFCGNAASRPTTSTSSPVGPARCCSGCAGRLGSDVADAIEEFAHDLSTSVDERLAARISAAGDGDVTEVIAGFAAEAAALAGDRDVLLSLDNAERLDEDDVRRLADLLTLLPDRVAIRLAYATADQSAHELLDPLQEADNLAPAIGLAGMPSGAGQYRFVRVVPVLIFPGARSCVGFVCAPRGAGQPITTGRLYKPGSRFARLWEGWPSCAYHGLYGVRRRCSRSAPDGCGLLRVVRRAGQGKYLNLFARNGGMIAARLAGKLRQLSPALRGVSF
jgi:hypothetical protein